MLKVATITALIVCSLFSAWSNTIDRVVGLVPTCVKMLIENRKLDKTRRLLRIVVDTIHPVPIDSWLDQSAALDNQDALWALAEGEPRLRGILFGHVHQEVDLLRGDVRILGTPSTCFQFAPGPDIARLDDLPPGWRWLDLHDNGDLSTGLGWLPADAGGSGS